MNLIEQLGGYECAKAEYDDPMYEDGELYTIKATGARFFKHNLADELLEYRRQHNIFEAGDVAVSVDGEPYLHKVELGTSKAHCIKIFSHDMAHSYWVHDVNYRHATDEEIKAGKRLEVP